MNTRDNGNLNTGPERVHPLEDLLPFHANGRISAQDRAQLDIALQENAELARRLTLVQEERAEAIALNEAVGAPSPRALDALLAKIEEEPKSPRQLTGTAGRDLMDRLGAMLAALSPRTLAYASAAAVAIIAIQGAVMTQVTGQKPGTYQTASTVEAGSFALVSFAPDARAAQIAETLKAAGASIIEGPRASGLYRVRLSASALPKEEVATRLATLRAAKGVVSSAEAEQ